MAKKKKNQTNVTAEKQPTSLTGKSRPKIWWDLLARIMSAGCGANEGMKLVAAWCKGDREVGKDPLWDEVLKTDWTADIEKISSWTRAALKKLAKDTQVDVVPILLGDSPEAFWVQGFPWAGGRENGDKLLADLRKRACLEGGEVDWDNQYDLGYYRPEKLPGKIWKRQPYSDTEEDYDPTDAQFKAAFDLWEAAAALGITDALCRGNLPFAKLLGKRKQVALLLGCNEAPHFIGLLTPAGWEPKR